MNTDAIVLRTSAYSESTLIVWLLTPDQGVVRALAKGARRIKSNNAAAFDMFASLRVQLRVAGEDRLGNVTGADLRDEWLYLRRDLKRLAYASVGMEVLGAVAATSPHEPFFYLEAEAFLRRLEAAPAPGSLLAALLLRLLHHAGTPPRMRPGLEAAELPERLAWDFAEGCILEAPPGVSRGGAGFGPARYWPIARELVQRLRPAFTAPPSLEGEFILPAAHGMAALRWLTAVWEDQLHQPIRSMEFLEKTELAPKSG